MRAATGEQINLRNRLSRAHWCGCFSCSDRELVRATGSTEVGVVGLYLATRYALELFEVSDVA